MMMSGSISGSKGGKWTSQLRTYFYTENGKIEVNRYSLQKCVEDLHRITNSEEIQYIGSYRCPLVENIEENLFAYHQFFSDWNNLLVLVDRKGFRKDSPAKVESKGLCREV